MAFTISRRAISWGRPPGFSSGISGSKISHSSSVTSDGYDSRSSEYFPIIPFLSMALLGFFLSLLFSIGQFSSFYTRSEGYICIYLEEHWHRRQKGTLATFLKTLLETACNSQE